MRDPALKGQGLRNVSTNHQQEYFAGHIAAREPGQLACLASPYSRSEGGPVLGADYAGAWLQNLAQAEIMAGWSGWETAQPAPAVRACDFVIVPPAVGWRDAPDVWAAVRLGLLAVKPVYLLRGCD